MNGNDTFMMILFFKICWRPVIWGLILQFSFGLITIRWTVGRAVFQCIANKVATFLDYAKDGAAFVFSQQIIDDGVFAFAVNIKKPFFVIIIEPRRNHWLLNDCFFLQGPTGHFFLQFYHPNSLLLGSDAMGNSEAWLDVAVRDGHNRLRKSQFRSQHIPRNGMWCLE